MKTKTQSEQASVEKVETFFREFLADPEKHREEWFAEARREHPRMTERQLQASWAQLAHQLGL